MDTNSGVTIREVYNLVDSRFRDVDSSVKRLEDKFDKLTTERIVILESKVAGIEGKIMMVPTMIAISISVFSFVVQYLILHK